MDEYETLPTEEWVRTAHKVTAEWPITLELLAGPPGMTADEAREILKHPAKNTIDLSKITGKGIY